MKFDAREKLNYQSIPSRSETVFENWFTLDGEKHKKVAP